MPFPTTGNAAPHLAELSKIAAECQKLDAQAREILKQIEPALIGRRVKAYGRLYQICQVQIHAGVLTAYGFTVSKKGKVGTRGFALYSLEQHQWL